MPTKLDVKLFDLCCTDNADVNEIKKLLKDGANPNIRFEMFQHSALIKACWRVRLDIVRALLDAGADVNMDTSNNETALHAACWGLAGNSWDCDLVRMLIDAGADVNVKDVFGITPLHVAVLEENAEVVKMLLDAGADVHAKDEHGCTPLRLAENVSNLEVSKLIKEYPL